MNIEPTLSESLADSKENSPPESIQKVNKGNHEPSPNFLKTFFFFQGLVSLTSFFVFISEADYFQAQYKDYLFYFWSIMPGNIAIPVSVMVQKKMSSLSLSNGNLVSTTVATLFVILTVAPAYFYPNTIMSFLACLVIFGVSSVFEYVQNSYALQILVLFDDKYTNIYYFGTGLCNILVMVLRFAIIALDLEPIIDVIFTLKIYLSFHTSKAVVNIVQSLCMFGFAFLVGLISVICQLKLNKYSGWQQRHAIKPKKTKKTSSKQVYPEQNSSQEPLLKGENIDIQHYQKELDYRDFTNAVRRHKSIISKAFVSNILDYIVVPAIMFSLIVRIWKQHSN